MLIRFLKKGDVGVGVDMDVVAMKVVTSGMMRKTEDRWRTDGEK